MIKLKLPSWIPHDKALHIVSGLIIFSIGWMICSPELGVIFSIVVGALKEINDKYWIIFEFRTSKTKKWSVSDFVLTFAIPLIIWLITEFT